RRGEDDGVEGDAAGADAAVHEVDGVAQGGVGVGVGVVGGAVDDDVSEGRDQAVLQPFHLRPPSGAAPLLPGRIHGSPQVTTNEKKPTRTPRGGRPVARGYA